MVRETGPAMRVIFDAGPQRWKLWFVLPLGLFCGGLLAWMGVDMFLSYGLDPFDGGVLKPLLTRVLLGTGFTASGLAIIAGILLYPHLYVTRIEEDDGGDGFRVTTAGLGKLRMVEPDDVVSASHHEGRSHAGGIVVNAPWSGLRLHGRRFPLIIDEQGDFLDPGAVYRLVDGLPKPELIPRPKRKLQGSRRRR
jgi:hypothetical protein